jgi:hypothetical protein
VKIVTIFISLLLSFNLMAASTGENRLSHLIDDLQFSLTVEWDQKDKEAFNKINDEFRQKIEAMVQEDGISKAELINLLEARVSNKKLMDEMQIRIKLMSANPTSSEIFSLFQEMKSSLYRQGASWNGEAVMVSSLVLVMIVFTIIWIRDVIKMTRSCADEGGHEVTTQENCGIRSVCVSYGDNYCYEYQEMYKCDEKTKCVM